MTELDRLKRTRAAAETPTDAPYAPPAYHDRVQADGSVIHEVCSRCGALWTGRWEHQVVGGVHRPIYEGGRVFRERNGHTYVYRCQCVAGAQLGNGIPLAPMKGGER